MERKSNFFICTKCKNLVNLITCSGKRLSCCGTEMQNMEPTYTEDSAGKHQPVIKRRGDIITVNVGSQSHPMTEQHAISWVALVTNKGVHRKFLVPGEEPVVSFAITDELPVAVYSYCNLHGLWKTQI